MYDFFSKSIVCITNTTIVRYHVEVESEDDSAGSGDYQDIDTTVSFPAITTSTITTTTQTVTVRITNDTNQENTENFYLNLKDASCGQIVSPNRMTITITDDDSSVDPLNRGDIGSGGSGRGAGGSSKWYNLLSIAFMQGL